MGTLRARDVAEYFLAQINEDSGDTISNLKLQKLIYYAQGLHLAIHDKRLFPEPIIAWDHGPVVRSVYNLYREYGGGAIEKPTGVCFSKFCKSQRETMDEVYKVFGQFSAWKLRNMTHVEAPWRDTPRDKVIKRARMRKYFKTLLTP